MTEVRAARHYFLLLTVALVVALAEGIMASGPSVTHLMPTLAVALLQTHLIPALAGLLMATLALEAVSTLMVSWASLAHLVLV